MYQHEKRKKFFLMRKHFTFIHSLNRRRTYNLRNREI